MKINKKTFGVVGVGMVGSQVERWLKKKKYKVFSFDKFKNIGSLKDINQADIIFLCLPTPHDKKERIGTNLSEFEKVIKFFKIPKIFIVKSTVAPGSTEKLQLKFKKHYFFHNPELLTESRAWREFSKPNLQILGTTKKSRKLAEDIMKILPKARHEYIISAHASEIFKFARNAFFATKVIFANHLYDLCQSYKIDYSEIEKIIPLDPWIGSQHWNIFYGGYRGFGGKCLPKDLKTFIKIFKSQKLNPELLLITDKINEKFLKEQNLTETLEKIWLNNKS